MLSKARQYLCTMEGFGRVDAGCHHHHIITELPEPLDEVGKPDLHACNVNERGLCTKWRCPHNRVPMTCSAQQMAV